MKRIYLLIAIFALSLICCLTACAGLENGKNNDDITPVEPIQTPDNSPPAEEQGDSQNDSMTYPDASTETFSYNNLTVQVTNVHTIKKGTMRLDENQTSEFDIFVVYPGAKLTVISAETPADSDGVPFAHWKLYYADGSKTGLKSEMPAISIDNNVNGIGAECAYILCFEIFDTAEKDKEKILESL